MKRPLIYFQELNTWDKVTIGLYLNISLGLYFLYAGSELVEEKKDILFWYPYGTQLFLYFVNYRSLRNKSVYAIWFLIGLFHYYFYLNLISDPLLEGVKVHAATGLRNTVILLSLFQVLRIVSLKIQGEELVCPSKSRTDLFEERDVTIIDFILFVIYIFFLVMLGLNFQFDK
ncbi:hypothetical protein [Rufibacter aurantiacus]|uniref:hypothetical protein n=1 Tax=Rufibacter aurantiacus TaxID=2817374 RepID=UPI001B3039D4|nr:hypothetical protein [Rufibacter aurantiacus]